MSTRSYAANFSPGDFLKDELESRGWSQIELAEILSRPPRVISEIIAGKRAISPETAKGLAAALGTSAEVWMNLEAAYQLAKAEDVETAPVVRRARLYGAFPVKELIRRKWVPDSSDIGELETSFCRFFGIGSVDEVPQFGHAAKKTEYSAPPKILQLAWLNRAEHIAKEQGVGSFSVAALKNAISKLKTHMRDVISLTAVPSILNEAGVRFVVVEQLAGAKLDGACFWINKSKSPVIAMTLRLDRFDNFWHTLFHEIDHLIHGEGKESPIVDVFEYSQVKDETKPEIEVRANQAAAEHCVSQKTLEAWLKRTALAPPKESIIAFADSIGVHPAIVVGQLQFRGIIPYSYHRDLLEKVRSVVLEVAMSDGFNVRASN